MLFLKTILARPEPILAIFRTKAFFKLAKPPVLDVLETFKFIRTYQKIVFKKRQFLYCFRKTPSKFAFFIRKIAKYGTKFVKTLID